VGGDQAPADLVAETTTPGSERRRGAEALKHVPLIETMLRRRSRRFGLGSRMDGEPFRFESRHERLPLTIEEEAIIVFAGTGVTGFSLGDLPYGADRAVGGGEIMVNQIARTIPSADGVNAVTPFVINDDGAFYIRRPQDYPKQDIPELVQAARRHEFVPLYERARVRLSDERVEVPRELPFTPPFNLWSTNVPGSTYFVLVSEVTTFALTLLFLVLSEEMGYFLYDERNGYAPAGLKQFGKSKGGHLHDDPNDLRLGTVNDIESYVMELVGVEQGLMLQGMQLAAEALGLGSFPHYGAQKWSWFEALGFRMEQFPLSKIMATNAVKTTAMRVLGKNPVIPVAVGLEVDGEALIKPYCPPYYPSMEAAVHAFVDSKYAEAHGIFRDGSTLSAWKDVPRVQSQIEKYSQRTIDAVVAYCEYVYGRYGRFLGAFGPVRNLMAFQVHHVDTDFYDHHFVAGAYGEAHVEHLAQWHEGDGAPAGP
jgi:hypothetical protein